MNNFFQRTLTSISAGIIFISFYLFLPHSFFGIFWAALGCYMLVHEWSALLPLDSLHRLAFSVIYPVAPWALLGFYAYHFRGLSALAALYPFMIAWSFDVAAYGVGKLCGWHKIWPSISPGKSWQGLIGGTLAVFGLHVALIPYADWLPIFGQSAWWVVIVRTLIYSAAAFAGDIGESWFKRRAGIKDSGTLLPGHGGVLDRFDSVLVIIICLIIEMHLR